MPKALELTGQIFDRLTVLERTKNSNTGKSQWICQCECGNKIIAIGPDLKNNKIKSCGCLKKENISQINPKINLIGKQFTYLTVIEEADEEHSIYYGGIKQTTWKCKCICGKYCYATSNDLNKKLKNSCGCFKESAGEYYIKKILDINNIKYDIEKTFQDCIFPNTRKLARFDFWIENKYIVEYDGIQHFKNTGYDTLEKNQYRDNFKNQWCKNNNIPLIRIPYTHLNDLCLEDLLLETSKFLINKEAKV